MAQELDTNSEDVFMSEILEMNESNENIESNEELMPFGLNSLLRDPLKLNQFNVSQTPRNPFNSYNGRKRKNTTRRCLSEVLDNSSFASSEPNLSPTFGQFGQSKDISMDDLNPYPTLTPIFTKIKTQASDNSENDSSVANSSITSISSPMFSTSEMNPIKRPNVPKIRKSNSLVASMTKKTIPFVRCHSANEATVMKAVQMSCADPSLIGDFTKSYALPLIQGKHQDLKSISNAVLAQVLNGHYMDVIDECVVIDCRYPYEFIGGHIRGALNVYSQKAILQQFIKNYIKPTVHQNNGKRHVLVFHCEFSSERGPTLSRFLRNNDRTTNKDDYPSLFHPEIYLLEGGYKAFFEKYPELCEPSEYLPMLSKEHEHELKHFRAIVKSLSTVNKCWGSVYKSSSNRGHV